MTSDNQEKHDAAGPHPDPDAAGGLGEVNEPGQASSPETANGEPTERAARSTDSTILLILAGGVTLASLLLTWRDGG